MSLAPGVRVGPYEVTAPLGAGGMGEVWRARDPRLGRDVAIKVLPAALAGDPERRTRFEREGRVLAALSHPNVAAVLGLEDAGGAPALVMELVEGPTLAERLAKDGALALPEALALARQVAEAVEYAHERGIVHRDLKPANVKLAPDGTAKVLDFGLAKALAPDEGPVPSSQITQSPTMSVGTQAGVLLGTAAYMAPEQARGKAVDRRADIWAFGVVLFEMLTGRQLFAGETVSDTIARILERQPDWGMLPARTPRRVRELLRRCLEKDAKQRLRDMGDVRLELEAALAALASGKADAEEGPGGNRAARVALVAAVALGALGGGWALRTALAPAAPPPLRLSAAVPDDLVMTALMFGARGDRALYASGTPRNADSRARSAVYRRALDEFEWRKVEGSEGKLSWDLSPDGRWLYAVKPVAEGSRELELVRMPVDGSAPPARVRPWGTQFAGWEVLPEGRIVVVESGIKRFAILAAGEQGAPKWRDLASPHPLGALHLRASLPDGRTAIVRIGYFATSGWTESAAVFELDTGRLELLEENAGSPDLLPNGVLLLTRGGTLLASPWDAKRRRLAGRPVAVMQGLRAGDAWGHAEVWSSPEGDIAFVLGDADALKRTLGIAWPDGRFEAWSDEARLFEHPPAVAPGGRLAAAVSVPPGSGTYEVLLLERGRPGARRFAYAAGEDCWAPRFSPDGRTLAWVRQGVDSTAGVWVRPLDGGSPARRVLAARGLNDMDALAGWYPDGQALLVTTQNSRSAALRRVALAGGPESVSDVVREAHSVMEGALSPDGRRIAYESYESGDPEVVVALLGPDGRAGPPAPVSRGYGIRPQWADDGVLLWATRTKAVMAARVSPALEVSAPEKRFDLAPWAAFSGAYASLPGGGLLVVRKAEGEDEVRRFDLVTGFAPGVKRAMERAARDAR
jgi:serine/threonine-protein kinase